MNWNIVYTISMGKHGNQRVPGYLENHTYDEVLKHIDKIHNNPHGFISCLRVNKALPVKNILLIEWSESK